MKNSNNISGRIIDIMNSLPKVTINDHEWVNLASLGIALKSFGIDYNLLGFEKLRGFIESFPELELYKDEQNQLPVYYVKARIGKRIRKSNNTTAPSLSQWAYMGDWVEMTHNLKNFAIDEPGHWGETEKDGRVIYPLLSSYINGTFIKLFKQKQILISDDSKYAVFNTGLVDSKYKPICAFFEKNKMSGYQDWHFKDFYVSGENFYGKKAGEIFSEEPKRAYYFDDPAELLYDWRGHKFPQIDHEHCIIERVERLPADFVRDNGPRDFNYQRINELSGIERDDYLKSLREAIRNDNEAYRRLVSRFDDAVNVALKKVEWNYKTAIPMYYSRKDKMCLMLPLSLRREDKVDVALVVNKIKAGYRGETILPLNWAYDDARLVCRPDGEWLSVVNYSIDE